MLKVFAAQNGIGTIGRDSVSIANELNVFLQNKNSNLVDILQKISKESQIPIYAISIFDINSQEMTRNKISYIQLPNKKEMSYSRSDFNIANLYVGSFSRGDYESKIAFDSSDKFKIPSVVDVLFYSDIVVEQKTIARNNDRYVFEDNYYISITPQRGTMEYVVSFDGDATGIDKRKYYLHAPSGEATEVFNIKRYANVELQEKVDKNKIEIANIQFMGMFPLFLELKIHVNMIPKEEAEAKNAIIQHFYKIGGRMQLFLAEDISRILASYGVKGTVAPQCTGNLYMHCNIKKEQTLSYPWSDRDISIPVEYDSEAYSKNNIVIVPTIVFVES